MLRRMAGGEGIQPSPAALYAPRPGRRGLLDPVRVDGGLQYYRCSGWAWSDGAAAFRRITAESFGLGKIAGG